MEEFIKINIDKAVKLDKDNPIDNNALCYFNKRLSSLYSYAEEKRLTEGSFRKALEKNYERLIIKRIVNFLENEKEKDFLNREERLKNML